jgi:hypothetical protein
MRHWYVHDVNIIDGIYRPQVDNVFGRYIAKYKYKYVHY